MACFQDIFILSNSVCLSQNEVIRLLQSGFVNLLMVVREVLRGKRELHKNTSLAMDKAFSFINMSLAQHARDSGNLLPLVQSVNSRGDTFNGIVLEGLFCMHREQTRFEGESISFGFWNLFQVPTPWDNPQEMYRLSKCIMRISNLLCTTKEIQKGHGLNPSKLCSMHNDQELFIELLCADKACPIIIRCPPLDLIVDSAPILGIQVRVGIATSSIFLSICNTLFKLNFQIIENLKTTCDSPVAQIITPTFDAAEEYLLRIELEHISRTLQHYIDVIKIAANFDSLVIVRDYLKKSFQLIDSHNAHQMLEIAMFVESEEFVLLSMNAVLQDFNCFMRTTGCFISRQNLFIASLKRLLEKKYNINTLNS